MGDISPVLRGFVDALKARVVQASGRLWPDVGEALKERVESIL
jgi:hypothetical protein